MKKYTILELYLSHSQQYSEITFLLCYFFIVEYCGPPCLLFGGEGT